MDYEDEFTEDTDDALNGTVEYCMTSYENSFAVLDSSFDENNLKENYET